MFPYPVSVPFMVGGQQDRNSFLENDPPARVKLALEYLSQLLIKTMPRAAASEHTIEWAPEAKLSANEVAAQGAACSLLVKYFSGDLKPDGWETQRKQAGNKEIQKGGKVGTYMRCFGCAPEFTGECNICNGRRTVLVIPSGS